MKLLSYILIIALLVGGAAALSQKPGWGDINTSQTFPTELPMGGHDITGVGSVTADEVYSGGELQRNQTLPDAYWVYLYPNGVGQTKAILNGSVVHTGTDSHVLAQTVATYDYIRFSHTMQISDDIVTRPNSILDGQGIGVLNFTAHKQIRPAESSTLMYFNITGDPSNAILIYENNVVVRGVNCINLTADASSCFEVYANARVVDGVTFDNCNAWNCSRIGFFNNGESSPKLISNITYTNCRTTNAGRYGQYNPWMNGFVLAENNDIQDCLVFGGSATGSWESGIHFEETPTKRRVRIIGFDSSGNGIKPSPFFGAGFVIGSGVSLIGCSASDNYRGVIYLGSESNSDPGIVTITTHDNIDTGVQLSSIHNNKINLLSVDDAVSLEIIGAGYNNDITMDSRNATGYAIEKSDISLMSDSRFMATITNPRSGIIFCGVENSVVDISIYQRLVNNAQNWIGEMENVDLRVNSVATDEAITLFGGFVDTQLSGSLKGNRGISFDTWTRPTCGLLHIENLNINATTGIVATTLANNSVVVDNNTIRFVGTAFVSGAQVSRLKYTENSGARLLLTGTSQAVAHGLAITPTNQSINVVKESEVTDWWFSAAPDATNFYINGTAGKYVDWAIN